MEEEVDIYGDLPGFNVDDFTNVTEQNKQISDRCAEFEKKVDELTKELKSARAVNNNLEVNLASLYKTAKAEIARKDRMITELRNELDNIKFRRGIHSKPVQTCSKPNVELPKQEKELNLAIQNDNQTWKLPDTTEFVCDNPPCDDEFDNEAIEQNYPQNKLVSTVFGKRLRKKILEEQEQERQQKIQSSVQVEGNGKKSSTDSVKSDLHTNDTLKSQEIILGQYVASSIDIEGVRCTSKEKSVHSEKHHDRRRKLEQQIDVQNSKILKIDDGKDMGHNSNRRRDDRDNSDYESSGINVAPKRQNDVTRKLENKRSYRRRDPNRAFDDVLPDGVVREDKSLKNVNQKSSTTCNQGNDMSHSRVASRLLLLSEGIDPDINSKYTDKRFKRQTFEDKKHNDVANERTSRSRSKSTDRGRWNSRDKRQRSPSRTSDKYSRDRQRSRHRDDRYKDGRNRFDQRSELKNRDRDTSREFSRDISDLREKIDKTNKRSSIRNKENCIRDHRRETSRTESRSRSGSTELIAQKRKTEKLSRRSRSRDRHNSRINDENFGHLDTNSRQQTSAVPKTKTIKDSGITFNKNETVTGDAVSLVSLEDGEIIDSTDSSPKKTCEITKIYDKQTELKIKDRYAPKELKHEIDMVCNPSSMKVEETDINFDRLFDSIPESSTEKSNLVCNTKDILNASKDEGIDNIAKFITNYSINQHSETSETAVDENSCEIKNRDFPHTTAPKIEGSSKKLPHDRKNSMHGNLEITSEADSFGISSTETISPTNMVKTQNPDKQWSLIEIKYTVKNDEENRRYRMALQNARLEQTSQNSGTSETDTCRLMSTEDAIQTPRSEISNNEAEANSEESDSNKKAESAPDPLKNTDSKVKTPATPLKSVYFSVRNKMKLTDADSNDSTKFMLLNPMETASNHSENSEPVPENKDDPLSSIQQEKIPTNEFKDQYASSSHTEEKQDQNNKSKKNPGQESVKTKSLVTNEDTINSTNGSESVSDKRREKSTKNRTHSIEDLPETIDSKVETRTLEMNDALNEIDTKQGNGEISAYSSVLVNRITDEVQKICSESQIDTIMDSQTRNTCDLGNKNQVATNSTSISEADSQQQKILASLPNDSTITILKTRFPRDSMDAHEETSKVTSESEEQGRLHSTEQSENNTTHVSNKRKLKSDIEKSGNDEEKSTKLKSRIEATTGKSIKKMKIIQCRRKRPIHLEDSSTLLTVINSDSTRELSNIKPNTSV